jgi:coenzyme F420-reducing hydrogenase beta subunit
MKSAGFAESLAWQLGVKPDRIGTVDFRVKQPNLPANQYLFSVTDKLNGRVHTAPMGKLAGRRWDGGYHRLKACDYCDDVFGETADITLGDAWLPEFSKDSGGTNVIVTRSVLAEKLISEGFQNGSLTITELPLERVVASQAGGLRDRREGLAYRLFLDEQRGRWHPKKRIEASKKKLTVFRKINYRLRRVVRTRSASNYRLCLLLRTILPYRIEMTFWHACFRMIQIMEQRLGKV